MKLLQLTLNNFKGIESFELDAGGASVIVFGDNATGKTTVMDAYLWLLSGKDSQGRADYQIKTLDKNGKEMERTDHSVEGLFDLEGKQVLLRRVYRELYKKPRGSAYEEFAGHTTDYYVDDVLVKKKDFEEKVAEIADGEILSLVTSINTFNQLHWKKRREILLEMFDNISDETVVEQNNGLAELPKVLNGKKLADYKRQVEAGVKRLSKELDSIPIRMDEVRANLPQDLDATTIEELQGKLTVLQKRIKEKTQEMIRIENEGVAGDMKKKISLLEKEMLDFQNASLEHYGTAIESRQKELEVEQKKVFPLQNKIDKLEIIVQEERERIAKLEQERLACREEWFMIKNRELAEDGICSNCGQPMPKEKIEEKQAEFNLAKAEELQKITAKGKKLRTEIDGAEKEVQEKEEQLDVAVAEVAVAKKVVKDIREKIELLRKTRDNYAEEPVYQKLERRKTTLIKELNDTNSSEGVTTGIKAEITSLEKEKEDTQNRLNATNQYQQGQKRLAELQKQQKEVARDYEEAQRGLFLVDLFVRTKMGMISAQVNGKFELARFKLFKELVNGNIEPCCETTYNGVPYDSLNNAAKVNVGLDIIKALGKHYGVSAPVFVDNAESVVKLIDPGTQTIRLVVKEGEELRVKSHAEKNTQQYKEAV